MRTIKYAFADQRWLLYLLHSITCRSKIAIDTFEGQKNWQRCERAKNTGVKNLALFFGLLLDEKAEN